MNPFSEYTNQQLAGNVMLNGKDYAISFFDENGGETAFGVGDEFYDWLEEVLKRLGR